MNAMKPKGDKRSGTKTEVALVRSSAAEYLTFVAAGGGSDSSVEMRYEDENIWLTQKMMAALYDERYTSHDTLSRGCSLAAAELVLATFLATNCRERRLPDCDEPDNIPTKGVGIIGRNWLQDGHRDVHHDIVLLLQESRLLGLILLNRKPSELMPTHRKPCKIKGLLI
jgi:hypothetical protein